MKKVIDIMGTDEQEVKDHIKALKSCGNGNKSAKE